MNFRSQFAVDASRYSTPPPPPPPTATAALSYPALAAVTSPNESAAPTLSPPGPFSSKSMTAVVLGAGIGFGGAIVLVVVGSLVIWYMRRMRTLKGSCEAPLHHHPKEDQFNYPNQHWQQNTATKPYSMVGLPPNSVCSPGAPSKKKHSSSSVPTPLKVSSSSSLGSEKLLTQSLSGNSVGIPIRTFAYEELAFATDGFCSSNLLGEGGFGYVYKGVLSDGREVAVKQLKIGSKRGEREFQSEVGTISCVHHKHLVSLVGYCSSGDRRVLVYDFVPNKTLDFHLHGKRGEAPPSNWVPLNWETRMKVAVGSAKGLAYLHEDCQPKIIHRDIKAANILLDNSFEAKVSDFGLARFTLDSDTHISTRVIGTFGYIAPEYAQTGKLTVRSDVFSFGVMVLELITGRRPIDKDEGQFCKEDNIVDWARPLLTQAMEDSNFDTLVDARLAKDYDFTEMSRMVTCAAACVRHLARLRPRMSQIVQPLEGKMPLHVLKEKETVSGGSLESSEFESIISMHDTAKFRKLIFENLELDSSECSGLNSEYTQQPSASSSECLRVNRNLGSSSEGRITETNQNE